MILTDTFSLPSTFSNSGSLSSTFANYEDCCHKNHLPRPKVIFPMYGLDWNIKALPEDKGLAVFSIVGRGDEFGFANEYAVVISPPAEKPKMA